MSKALTRLLFLLMVLLLVTAACQPAVAPTPTAAPVRPTVTKGPTAVPTAAAMPVPSPTLAPLPPTPTRVPFTPTPVGLVPQYGGTLRTIYASEPAHHDPYLITAGVGVYRAALESIIQRDRESGEPICELCESWEYKDPTTLIFKMRQGVKFQNRDPVNGREMVAEDVVYSINWVLDPKIPYSYRSRFAVMASVKALDRYTVEMKLSGPSAGFLYSIAGEPKIRPKEAMDKFGDFKDANNIMGTGPFLAGKYTPGVGGTMTRNPDYWQKGKPYLDAYEQTSMVDDATIMAAWRTGRLEFGGGAGGGAPATVTQMKDLLRTNPQIESYQNPNPCVEYLQMDLYSAPFSDIRVRKALFLTIDRDEVVKLSFGSPEGANIAGPIPWRVYPGWTWSEQELRQREGYRKPKDADRAEAKRLLAEAGYPTGFRIVADVCECFPLFNLWQLETAIPQLKQVGIEVTMRVVDQTRWFEMDAQKTPSFRPRTPCTALEVGDALSTPYHSKAPRNFANYKNPEVDKLIDEQAVTVDVQKRQQLVKRTQEIIWNDYPYIWVYNHNSFFVRQPWVKGPAPTIYGGTKPEDIWIDQAIRAKYTR